MMTITALFALLLVLAGCTQAPAGKSEDAASALPAAPQWETKSSGSMNMGDAQIDISPRFEGGRMMMEFSANTHSVPLPEYDLEGSAHLYADGTAYEPVSADALVGHHNRGAIVFELPYEPDSFTLTIDGIPGMSVRTYHWGEGPIDVRPEELSALMGEEDIYLVDVHVPEQQHLEGTDAVMPYDELDVASLPKDKALALYCRSGHMSLEAGEKLTAQGFKVYNLLGGANAWKAEGLPLAS